MNKQLQLWPYHPAIRRWFVILLITAGIQLIGPPSGAATIGKEITDRGITDAVEDALAREKGIMPNEVDVSTSEGIVTLSGLVDDVLAEDRAVKTAEITRGVRGVIDRISVAPIARPDEDVRKDILLALQHDPATDSYQVSVSVHDSVATLTGSVGSYEEKQLAARIARGIKGLKAVRNDVTVNYSAKRTDQEIDADVKALLEWDVWINGDPINATVKGGVVTLTGTVGSALGRSRAVDDAWVNGVTAVNDSGLKIEPSAHKGFSRKRDEAFTSDTQIERALETSLHLDPRVSAFSPDVSVDEGMVILRGVVGNLMAKIAAEQDANDIVGVWRVNNFLKVKPKERPTDVAMKELLIAALSWDPILEGAAIDVAVSNRVAELSGMVDSSFQKIEAQNVASRTKGVLSIRNHLKVEPEFWTASSDRPDFSYDEDSYYNSPPYRVSENAGTPAYLSDEQIRKNIENALFWSPFVERDDIKVSVDDGIATLTGTVGSWIGWREANKDAHKSGAIKVLNRVKIEKGAWLWQ